MRTIPSVTGVAVFRTGSRPTGSLRLEGHQALGPFQEVHAVGLLLEGLAVRDDASRPRHHRGFLGSADLDRAAIVARLSPCMVFVFDHDVPHRARQPALSRQPRRVGRARRSRRSRAHRANAPTWCASRSATCPATAAWATRRLRRIPRSSSAPGRTIAAAAGQRAWPWCSAPSASSTNALVITRS